MAIGSLSNRVVSALRRWSRGETHRNAAARRWELVRAELGRSAYITAQRVARHRDGPPRHRRPQWWDEQTTAFPEVGRPGFLTPAQEWRANGGRWDNDNGRRDDGQWWGPRPATSS